MGLRAGYSLLVFFFSFFFPALDLFPGLFPTVLAGTARLWYLELSCDAFSLISNILGTDTRFERGTDWLPGLAADVVGIGPG